VEKCSNSGYVICVRYRQRNAVAIGVIRRKETADDCDTVQLEGVTRIAVSCSQINVIVLPVTRSFLHLSAAAISSFLTSHHNRVCSFNARTSTSLSGTLTSRLVCA